MNIDERKSVLIVCLSVFALLWVIVFLPLFMTSEFFTCLVPPLQYIILNLGFVILFFTVVGVPLSYLIKKEVNLLFAVRLGVSMWLGASLIYDLLQPPYYVGLNGETLLDVPPALTGTAVDATVKWCWEQLGVRGPLLFYCVYFFTPVIIVFCMSLLLTGKKFIEMFRS